MLCSSLITSFCEDRVLFLLIHLTRMLCHLFKFFSSYQVLHLFLVGVLPNYIILIHSYLVSTRVVSIPSCPLCSSIMSLQPSSSRYVPCSSFLTDCLQTWSSPLFCFFQFVQPLKVRGFTRLSKKQLSFTTHLPLPFLSGAVLDLGTRSFHSGGVL